jgi:hypothetical protein
MMQEYMDLFVMGMARHIITGHSNFSTLAKSWLGGATDERPTAEYVEGKDNILKAFKRLLTQSRCHESR